MLDCEKRFGVDVCTNKHTLDDDLERTWTSKSTCPCIHQKSSVTAREVE